MTRENITTATNQATTGVSTATASRFRRKIGNTTFVVSVAFNDRSNESIEDKILRLVASEIQNGEVFLCN